MTEEYGPEASPEMDADWREQKTNAISDLEEATDGHDHAVVLAALEELLARRVNKRAHHDFDQRHDE